MRKQLTDEQKIRLMAYRELGKSYVECAVLLGRNPSTIRSAAQRIEVRGTIANAPRSGRPPLTSPRGATLLCRKARADEHTRRQPLREIGLNSCPPIKRDAARKILRDAGLTRNLESIRPQLSGKQVKARLDWAKAHQTWDENRWRGVLWSDESSVSRYSSCGRLYVTRLPSEKYDPACVYKKGTKHRVSVMVWGCFAGAKRGPLHLFDQSVTGQVYLETLQTHLRGSLDACSADVFMQDNAAVHTARIVRNWLHDSDVQMIPWPANSPDLNPIEHVWSRLKALLWQHHGEELARETSNINCEARLRNVLPKMWELIDESYLERLACSMPARIKEVIEKKGHNTRY